jgi:hypothetical protein
VFIVNAKSDAANIREGRTSRRCFRFACWKCPDGAVGFSFKGTATDQAAATAAEEEFAAAAAVVFGVDGAADECADAADAVFGVGDDGAASARERPQ